MSISQALGKVNVFIEQALRRVRVHVDGDGPFMNRERVIVRCS